MARPTIRSKKIEDAILGGIRSGLSLSKICDDRKLPTQATIFDWLASDYARRAAQKVEEGEVLFLDRYNIATKIRTAVMQEEILQIADDSRNDTYKDSGGKTVVDYDHIHRSKVRIETRKWLMAKLEPKKYGDKPSEVNVQTNVHNQGISIEQQREWQRREKEALQRNGNTA